MKNIVWLASYPKSGNTWFRMFLANYLSKSEQPVALSEITQTSISSDATIFEEETGLNPFELTFDEVDLYRPDVYRNLSMQAEQSGGWLYKKTHDAYTVNNNREALFPKDVSFCAVYFVRNPLDVCVSYANHNASKIRRSLEFLTDEKGSIGGKKQGQIRQILSSWQKHYQSWNEQREIPVYKVRYEDMQNIPIKTFGSIIKFLQLGYDEERLKHAIINSNFKTLKQMEEEKGFHEKPQNSKSFFWKGIIGNYRNHLSQEQIEQITASSYKTMKQLGYLDINDKLTV